MQNVLGVAVVVLVTAQFTPQTVQVVRGNDAGVAAATYWLQLANSLMWLAYAATVGEPGIAVAHAIVGVCAATIVAVLTFRHHGGGVWVLAPVVVGAALVAVGPVATVAVGAFVFAFGAVPQLVKVLVAPDVSGVALTTWVVAVCSGLLWLSYGLAISRWQVWLPVCVPLGCAAAIVVRLLVVRARPLPT